jgi:hypothetical protein
MPLEARRLRPEEVQEKASRKWQELTPLRADKNLQLAYIGTDSLLWGYEVGEEEGFIVIAGDDRARAVLAYGLNGSLDEEEMPENLRGWLNFYEQEIRRLPEDEAEAVVQDLPTLRGEVGEVLLETPSWDQLNPYNNFCPTDIKTWKRTAAGCVATAMAEVMYFHRWPEYGSGGSLYAYVDNRRQDLYESFMVWYDWNNMLTTYVTDEWTESQANAVARLVYHCGRATDMNYSASGSGAMSFAMQRALVNHFTYRADCRLAFRDLYGKEEWEEMIRQEITQQRPVLYSGTGSSGGHMFVVDGFREDGFFHINWGWSARSNGYFVLSALNPVEQGTGGATDGSDSGFNTNQDALLGLAPSMTGEGEPTQWEIFFTYLGNQEELPGLYANTDRIEKERSFKLYYSGLLNYGYRTYTGHFIFAVVDGAGRIKETIAQIDWGRRQGNLSPNVIYNEPWGIQTMITTEICEGDKICLYYTIEDGSVCPMRGEAGTRLSIDLYPPTDMAVAPAEATPLETGEVGCYDLQGREIPCGQSHLPYVQVLRDSQGRIFSSLRLPERD